MSRYYPLHININLEATQFILSGESPASLFDNNIPESPDFLLIEGRTLTILQAPEHQPELHAHP